MADMTGYRRAAAAIHALSEADKRWVLAELPEADRSTVLGYLEELKGLGFTHKSTAAEDCVPADAVVPQQPIEFIRDASAAEIFAVLDSEPSSLVVQLLAIENWRWKSPFMQMCSPLRQERIRAALASSNETGSARRHFLIQVVGERIKAGRKASPSVFGSTSSRDTVTGVLKQARSTLLRLVQSWKR